MSEIILSEDERKGLKGMVVEADRCMQEVDSQREAIKDIGNAAKDKFGVEKKVFNKMVSTYHKHTFNSVQSEHDEFEYLYESVINGNTNSATPEETEEE